MATSSDALPIPPEYNGQSTQYTLGDAYERATFLGSSFLGKVKYYAVGLGTGGIGFPAQEWLEKRRSDKAAQQAADDIIEAGRLMASIEAKGKNGMQPVADYPPEFREYTGRVRDPAPDTPLDRQWQLQSGPRTRGV